MSPRKFIEGSAQQSRVYNSGPSRRCVKTKVVRYKCGCEVVIGDYQEESDAPTTCAKHHEPIKEIVTRESFIDS